MTLSGCSGFTFSPASKSMSQFDVKLMDIGFKRNTALFSQDYFTSFSRANKSVVNSFAKANRIDTAAALIRLIRNYLTECV